MFIYMLIYVYMFIEWRWSDYINELKFLSVVEGSSGLFFLAECSSGLYLVEGSSGLYLLFLVLQGSMI